MAAKVRAGAGTDCAECWLKAYAGVAVGMFVGAVNIVFLKCFFCNHLGNLMLL